MIIGDIFYVDEEVPVRCRGCSRTVCTSSSDRDTVTCATPGCRHDPWWATPQDERDAVIDALVLAGHPVPEVAALFEVTRQRAYQILARRRTAR